MNTFHKSIVRYIVLSFQSMSLTSLFLKLEAPLVFISGVLLIFTILKICFSPTLLHYNLLWDRLNRGLLYFWLGFCCCCWWYKNIRCLSVVDYLTGLIEDLGLSQEPHFKDCIIKISLKFKEIWRVQEILIVFVF